MNIYKIILVVICLFSSSGKIYADALVGEVSKDEYKNLPPQIIDYKTKLPINNAIVAIPSENKFTKSDNNGNFQLSISKAEPIILSVQKEGYRPFSLTIKDGHFSKGLKLEMKELTPFNVVVSDDLMHLGDNSYSEKSSGACLIHAPCVGPEFSKQFYVGNIDKNKKAYVSIGSIIGLDTVQAMRLGQNRLTSAISTPLEIYVNKIKIGELKINGDNQKIPIPTKILNKLANNTLTVKTGHNKNSNDFPPDYDDVEIMNLIVDIN